MTLVSKYCTLYHLEILEELLFTMEQSSYQRFRQISDSDGEAEADEYLHTVLIMTIQPQDGMQLSELLSITTHDKFR